MLQSNAKAVALMWPIRLALSYTRSAKMRTRKSGHLLGIPRQTFPPCTGLIYSVCLPIKRTATEPFLFS